MGKTSNKQSTVGHSRFIWRLALLPCLLGVELEDCSFFSIIYFHVEPIHGKPSGVSACLCEVSHVLPLSKKYT